jgi:hypothetical protein
MNSSTTERKTRHIMSKEKYKQTRADWALVFMLTLLYSLVFQTYYHSPMSRVLAQAGWEKSLNLLSGANSAGIALGSVLIILLNKRESVPHSYVTIASGWGLYCCMLSTGYLLIFHAPPLWILILLRFLEGIGLTMLFQSCLHLFHWGIYQKVKSWEFEDKQQLELAVGKKQARRSIVIYCLSIPCELLSFWQLGNSESNHPAWFLTAIIAMGVFTLLTLRTTRFPKDLRFLEDGSNPKEEKTEQPTVSLKSLYFNMIGVLGPATTIVAAGTYLPVYTTLTLVPLITGWGTLSMILGSNLVSKIHPCWNSTIIQSAYGLIGIGLLLMWCSNHAVVLSVAMILVSLSIALEWGVLSRCLLVQVPDSQKMSARAALNLSQKTAQVILISLLGIVANYFGIRWMWLSFLLTIPIGIVCLKRFSLLQPSTEDLRKRRVDLVSQVIGVTFLLARKW